MTINEKVAAEQIEKLFIEWWGESGNKYMGDPFMKLRAAFYEGHNSGCIAQAKADRKAVIKAYDECGAFAALCSILAKLAAAQIVKGE
jgi:hypothetical protein